MINMNYLNRINPTAITMTLSMTSILFYTLTYRIIIPAISPSDNLSGVWIVWRTIKKSNLQSHNYTLIFDKFQTQKIWIVQFFDTKVYFGGYLEKGSTYMSGNRLQKGKDFCIHFQKILSYWILSMKETLHN